ncbi:MAG: D-hexose-6-phosphate mutarotase [Gemmatimonadaceae bacterium]
MPQTTSSAGADVGAGLAGRSRVLLSHPAGGTAELYAHGGHVLSWRPPSGEVLFFSSRRDASQEKHAGIPIVFPQFGKGTDAAVAALPQHGFARSSEWTIGSHGTNAKGAATATLTLRSDAAIRKLWPHDFLAELTVTLTNELTLTLRITNTGAAPFSFTAGYHSYFRVADARTARVEGLQGLRYRDKVLDFAESADNTPALVPNGETDRVYLGAPARLRLRDARRCLRIESSGFANIVVWNPGPGSDEKYDFAPGEWSQFVCVEPATVFNPIVLAPGKSWVGGHTVCVEAG